MPLQALCIISYPLVNSNLSYSPETPNLGQMRRFLEPCDLEIWRMTFKNNRAPLLCYFKLCAENTIHRAAWSQLKKSFALMSRMCQGISYHDTLFKLMTKKTSKFWVTGALWGVSIDEWFPSQRASNTESILISNHDTLFKLMTKKKSTFWITGALWGVSIDEWFPSQRASNTFCQDLQIASIPDWLRCQADWGWWHFSINWITLMLPTNVGITGTLLMFLSTSCLNQ